MIYHMKKSFAETLGGEVRRHRKVAGLTQAQLAKMAGIGQSIVVDVERGKAGVRMSTILSVFEVLNMRFDIRGPLNG